MHESNIIQWLIRRKKKKVHIIVYLQEIDVLSELYFAWHAC